MDPTEDRLEALLAEWEALDPDSVNIDQPPREMDELPDLPPPAAPMVLPEMDLRDKPPPPAAPMAAQSQAPSALSQPRDLEPAQHDVSPAKVDPKTLNWEGLSDSLRNAELRAMQTRAGENMRANIVPGYRPDMEGGEAQVAAARRPLDLAKEKQGMEARDLSVRSQRNALGVKDAMDNPNSLQSQKAREAWRAFGLPTPPGFDNWSANEVQRNIPGAQDSRKFSADQTAAQAKAEADARGETFDREKFEESKRHNKQTEGAAWLAAERAGQKIEDAKTQDVPPGYEVMPGSNPGPDSRKKFTALVASQQKLKKLTERMREKMAGLGRAGRVENYDELNQLATAIGLESKNVADLGALSGPDLGLMNAMAQNPTTAWNIFRDSDISKNMKGLDAWADDSVAAGEHAYGFRKTGGAGGGEESTVTLTHKDGRAKRVKKSIADAYLMAHPNEATVSE